MILVVVQMLDNLLTLEYLTKLVSQCYNYRSYPHHNLMAEEDDHKHLFSQDNPLDTLHIGSLGN